MHLRWLWLVALAFLLFGCFQRPSTAITYTKWYDYANHDIYQRYFDDVVGDLTGEDAIIALHSHMSQTIKPSPIPLQVELGGTYSALDVLVYQRAECSEVTYAMNTLAASHGYPARSVWLFHVDGVNEHTVSEIYYDGSWHLFDANHGTYYLADGHVASFEELRANPDIVANTVDNAGFDPEFMAGFYVRDPIYHVYLIDLTTNSDHF